MKDRNRAICKSCNTIIESISRYDYVTCKCGGLAIDGGPEYRRVCFIKEVEHLLLNESEGCKTCSYVEPEGLCRQCYGVDGVTEVSEGFICENYRPFSCFNKER